MTKKIEGMAEIEDLPNGELKIHFEPGCFDEFDGTQEELDSAISEITRLINSGEFLNKTESVDMDQLYEEDPELAEKIVRSMQQDTVKRKLQ
jgi:hypothetical protein